MPFQSSALLTGQLTFARRVNSCPVSIRDRKRCSVLTHGLGDDFKKLMDSMAFENWAPRSSRTWRLGMPDPQTAQPLEQDEEKERLWQSLEEGVLEARESQDQFDSDLSELSELDIVASSTFTSSTDEDLASALNERISKISGTIEQEEAEEEEEVVEVVEELDEGPLNGKELRELIYTKWGKTYDVSIIRRDVVGKTLVCLNVMWVHLEQKSCRMTEDQYVDKMETMAAYMNTWGQAQKVRSFLKQPARSSRGLPSKPIVGSAVSIQLDLDDSTIEKWFGRK